MQFYVHIIKLLKTTLKNREKQVLFFKHVNVKLFYYVETKYLLLHMLQHMLYSTLLVQFKRELTKKHVFGNLLKIITKT